MTFRATYRAELDLLQQLCDELAIGEPGLAPMLGRQSDPAVTRLVEGLAFSFARLRQRIEDDLPEQVHPILDALCPDLLRPIPSATVVHVVPSAKTMTRQIVPAGTSFGAQPVEGAPISFRSTVDCELTPWQLSRVELSPARTSLRLHLELHPGADLGACRPDTLRLFFAHPLSEALTARSFVLDHARGTTARSGEHTVRLPAPRPPVARTGDLARTFLALRDYFTFPHGHAFLELPGCTALPELGAASRIELEIDLDAAVPPGLSFDERTVLLHAVVAVDVFRPTPLTLPLTDGGQRTQLRFGPDLEGAAVYAIERVSLVSRALQSHRAEPWAALFGAPGSTSSPLTYEVHRTGGVLDTRVEVGLSFAASGALLREKVVAEVEVLATHGARTAKLGLGEVCVPTTTSPSLTTFRNVTPVTRGLAPQLAGDRAWELLRLLKSNLAALTTLDSLSALLALANVPAAAAWPDAKPDATRFVPLLRVSRTPGLRPDGAILRRGARVRLDLETRWFSGNGDVHLFGQLLVPWLAAAVRPDEWIDVALHDAQGALLREYPVAYGTHHVL